MPTLTAARTFWEKATLLHAEHHRNPEKPPKDRMFRHYYDMVMLNKHNITNAALKDTSLLETVLINKKTYFASPSANYQAAQIGTLKLLPNNLFVDRLRQDCTNMADMFFGDAPDFDFILSEIKNIETIINKK